MLCVPVRAGCRRLLLVTHHHAASFSSPAPSSDFSTSPVPAAQHKYKLVIAGGGCGGTALANVFSKKLGKGNVAIIEPSDDHFYQPMWTLIGAGIKSFEQSQSRTEKYLPSGVDWIKQRVSGFDPDNNTVELDTGGTVQYDYLVTALGLQLNYHKIPGAVEALENDPKVCSNYHRDYVKKTWPALQAVKGGKAIFTFPNTTIKCAGAPQKICYLADAHFRKNGIRDSVKVYYNTSLPAVFGIPHYAKALNEIVKKRDIILNTRTSLCEVRHDKNEAVFELLDEPGKTVTYDYSLLHISPPCSAPDVIAASPLADASGYVEVNRETLRHTRYGNVFGIGDCTNAPTAKTAAAVATQTGIIKHNLRAVMAGKDPYKTYNGYTSCPLVTGNNKCILAEFGYDGQVIETFAFDQSKERRSMYFMKKEGFPFMYWTSLLTGLWQGPGPFRFLTNPTKR